MWRGMLLVFVACPSRVRRVVMVVHAPGIWGEDHPSRDVTSRWSEWDNMSAKADARRSRHDHLQKAALENLGPPKRRSLTGWPAGVMKNFEHTYPSRKGGVMETAV
jgi:hypothetical protein